MLLKQRRCIAIALVFLLSLNACSRVADQAFRQLSSTETQLTTTADADMPGISWQEKLQRLARGEPIKFRILQLGDSHTAGDFFTDHLRERLQQQWGNAGIGWVYPSDVRGQRMAKIGYSGYGWETLTSRRDEADFPMGGIIAHSTKQANEMIIAPHQTITEEQFITFSLHPITVTKPFMTIDAQGKRRATPSSFTEGDWRYFSFKGYLPISYHAAPEDEWEVSYINIENGKPGIILSAMGINGAQLKNSKKWRKDWTHDLAQTKADLVILSYGTNEAFADPFDGEAVHKIWLDTVRQIRHTLPNAGILIVGAPESLSQTTGKCGQRAPSLNQIQQWQQQIAKQEHLLYWSWQEAMGGVCSMKKWIAQDLGRKDGVHFSAKGYDTAADKLAEFITHLAQ